MLVCWSILLKIEPELWFLKIDRFFFGNLNMAKMYERLLSTKHHREKGGTGSIPDVKICRAIIVLAWLTAWKYLG